MWAAIAGDMPNSPSRRRAVMVAGAQQNGAEPGL